MTSKNIFSGIWKEHVNIRVSNPVLQPGESITEAKIADLNLSLINAIYPDFRAINSGRVTQNYTYYPRESLVGRNASVYTECTGYGSFVKPFGKPIIREHKLQSDMWGSEADIPMGRCIYSSYVGRKQGETFTPDKRIGYPGYVEGDGYLRLVAQVTDQESIGRILGRNYHTVSIGSKVTKVVESISGVDIAKAYRRGEDTPKYERGNVYKIDGEDRLSYWIMGPVRGKELSYVNSPSDELANTMNPDLGEQGVRILLAQKSQGKKEFTLHDAATCEHVSTVDESEFCEWDPTFAFIDSGTYDNGQWIKINKELKDEQGKLVTESLVDATASEEDNKTNMKIKNITEYLTQFKEGETNKDWLEKNMSQLDEFLAQKRLGDRLTPDLDFQGVEFIDTEQINKLTETVSEALGEWDATAAKVTLALYEGAVEFTEDLEKPVTVKELFSFIPEVDQDLLSKIDEEVATKETVFLGQDLKKARTEGQDLLGYATSIYLPALAGKSTEYPLITLEGSTVHPLTFSSYQELKDVSENVDRLASQWSLSEEQKTHLENSIKSYMEVPQIENLLDKNLKDLDLSGLNYLNSEDFSAVKVSNEALYKKYTELEFESKETEYLRTLVALSRKLKLSKKNLEEAENSYKFLGREALVKLLSSIPDEAANSSIAAVNPQTTQESKTEDTPVVQNLSGKAVSNKAADSGKKPPKKVFDADAYKVR